MSELFEDEVNEILDKIIIKINDIDSDEDNLNETLSNIYFNVIEELNCEDYMWYTNKSTEDRLKQLMLKLKPKLDHFNYPFSIFKYNINKLSILDVICFHYYNIDAKTLDNTYEVVTCYSRCKTMYEDEFDEKLNVLDGIRDFIYEHTDKELTKEDKDNLEYLMNHIQHSESHKIVLEFIMDIVIDIGRKTKFSEAMFAEIIKFKKEYCEYGESGFDGIIDKLMSMKGEYDFIDVLLFELMLNGAY